MEDLLGMEEEVKGQKEEEDGDEEEEEDEASFSLREDSLLATEYSSFIDCPLYSTVGFQPTKTQRNLTLVN